MRYTYRMTLGALALVLTALPLPAQDAPAAVPANSANSQVVYDAYYADVDRQQAEHAQRLREIDQQRDEALKAYRAENVRRAQALAEQNNEAQKQLAEQGLQGDARKAEHERLQSEDRQRRQEYAEWRDATAGKIQSSYLEARDAELAGHKKEMARLLAERNSVLEGLMKQPAQLGALDLPGSRGTSTAEGAEAAAKSDATGAELYAEHCDTCHGSSPGTRQSRYDLYEAVVYDDAAYFLNRVRNGPGPMPRRAEIQALTDAQIFSIRDFVRQQGDINTGVVARDETEKVPDAEDSASGSDAGTSPGTGGALPGVAHAGLPPVTPGSPLPAQGPDASSDVAREAHARATGTADLTCNVSAGVEVRWIAPLAWRSGWVPPGGNMESEDASWDKIWMLSLRARLEDPAQTQSNGHPRPGWCTWTSGSLGSAAGKEREISILAHTTSWPFDQFEFTAGDVRVWRSSQGASTRDRGVAYTQDVIHVVHGLILGGAPGNANSSGEVHARVRRIDDRWSSVGEPVFVIVP